MWQPIPLTRNPAHSHGRKRLHIHRWVDQLATTRTVGVLLKSEVLGSSNAKRK